jgi:hypothetical protein
MEKLAFDGSLKAVNRVTNSNALCFFEQTIGSGQGK